jgi:formylglycine-generating enzyme required for sulfatase activity
MQKIAPQFWVSRTEVPQKVYQKVAGGNPSAFPGEERPVEGVSWNGAIEFCENLTAHEATATMLPEGFAYWLPTQAQWESLAAATSLDLAVTSAKGSRRATEPVGSLGANAAGLCDILGNVMEWTADRNATYDYRVARGMAWNTSMEVELRPEFRVYKGPNETANSIGFRVVLVPEAEAKTK